MQHLLSRAKWDAEKIRDDTRDIVISAFGAPEAIVVVDETGDIKKGVKTVGVQRQYSGTAGRIENCQIAVYLTYASTSGHALIDRALYVPHRWTDHPDRCTDAGVPTDVEFATKPALAATVIRRALHADVPFSWVAADEVYGADPDLQTLLQDNHIGYVLAIRKDTVISRADGPHRIDTLAVDLPADAWQTMSAGEGSKGPRWYSWAWLATTETPLTAATVRR